MKNHIVLLSVEIEKTTNKGETKRVNETYLAQYIDVLTEAEKRALELFNGDCDVNSIKRLPESYKEIVNEHEDKPFYLATLVALSIDDEGNEKELRYKVYVRADDINEAHTLMKDYISQGLDDMKLEELKKTRIINLL